MLNDVVLRVEFNGGVISGVLIQKVERKNKQRAPLDISSFMKQGSKVTTRYTYESKNIPCRTGK